MPALVTHALYAAGFHSLAVGFGEGCFVAALAAVAVDVDSPRPSLLHSPWVAPLPLLLLPTPLSGYAVPLAVGIGSHLLLDGLTRQGVVLLPGRRFPGRSVRRSLPAEESGGLNLGVSALSVVALLYALL